MMTYMCQDDAFNIADPAGPPDICPIVLLMLMVLRQSANSDSGTISNIVSISALIGTRSTDHLGSMLTTRRILQCQYPRGRALPTVPIARSSDYYGKDEFWTRNQCLENYPSKKPNARIKVPPRIASRLPCIFINEAYCRTRLSVGPSFM